VLRPIKPHSVDTVALAGLVLGADCAIVAQSIKQGLYPSLPLIPSDLAINKLVRSKLVHCKGGKIVLAQFSTEYVERVIGAHAAASVCSPI